MPTDLALSSSVKQAGSSLRARSFGDARTKLLLSGCEASFRSANALWELSLPMQNSRSQRRIVDAGPEFDMVSYQKGRNYAS